MGKQYFFRPRGGDGRSRAPPPNSDGARLCRRDQPQQVRRSNRVECSERAEPCGAAGIGRGRHSRAPGQGADAPRPSRARLGLLHGSLVVVVFVAPRTPQLFTLARPTPRRVRQNNPLLRLTGGPAAS